MSTLLLIDDDDEVLSINCKYLSGEGYSVYTASNPTDGLKLIRQISPDCIILDIMMPQADGYQVCKKIRTFSDVPIIFLTGKSSEDDKITGLLTGADDYMVKPYSLRELRARIDVLLRRFAKTQQVPNNNLIQIQNLTIDKIAHKAIFQGEDLGLANREYEVLLYLAEHPNQEVTFEELGTALFGYYQDSDRRSVMVNVSRLRKKFENNYELKNMIETVWSKGYRLIMK